jgi:hypothetical protein
MSGMRSWQRYLFFMGEVVLLIGIGWASVRFFYLRTCPTGPFNDVTLILSGLLISLVPIPPFKQGGRAPVYISEWVARLGALAIFWWVLALLGTIYALYSRLLLQPGSDWVYGLVPAVLYLWFATVSKTGDPFLEKPQRGGGKDG